MNIRHFKAAFVAVAVLAGTGGLVRAELALAQSGTVIMDEAHAQMGGPLFQVTNLQTQAAKKA
ncbi:hypothetical protein [Methylobacterium durans]|uniref:Uncharacterized protein n=1 Tax=Methylobacterium durans TaxID=2202825 RepID=A0A2U8WB70_9HYPH|nr:hypothetical protein [Methylobacterium durans]AWN42690.1 hypothetical protein DK389_22025 [Methylobacterium durans]